VAVKSHMVDVVDVVAASGVALTARVVGMQEVNS
jgi:hypothetical protein